MHAAEASRLNLPEISVSFAYCRLWNLLEQASFAQGSDGDVVTLELDCNKSSAVCVK